MGTFTVYGLRRFNHSAESEENRAAVVARPSGRPL